MSCKVSVVMSVHNGQEHLREAVEGILAQTLPELEFLVMDDGSTDGSAEILREYARSDPRVRLFRHEARRGLPRSLNELLDASSGEYVARQDADDLSLPYRLQTQVEYLETHPELTLVGSACGIRDRNGAIKGKTRPLTDEKRLKSRLLQCNAIAHPTILFRNRLGIRYREKFFYTQDYDLYLRLLSDGMRLANLEEALVIYRYDEGDYTKKVRHALYGEAARRFFRERERFGSDRYDGFDAGAIERMEEATTSDPDALLFLIRLSIGRGDYGRARSYIARLCSLKGWTARWCVVYGATFAGRCAVAPLMALRRAGKRLMTWQALRPGRADAPVL